MGCSVCGAPISSERCRHCGTAPHQPATRSSFLPASLRRPPELPAEEIPLGASRRAYPWTFRSLAATLWRDSIDDEGRRQSFSAVFWILVAWLALAGWLSLSPLLEHVHNRTGWRWLAGLLEGCVRVPERGYWLGLIWLGCLLFTLDRIAHVVRVGLGLLPHP